MLGAWILWKYCNACVFDGSAPCLQVALQAYWDELHLWQAAGAKGPRRRLGGLAVPIGCCGQVLPSTFFSVIGSFWCFILPSPILAQGV